MNIFKSYVFSTVLLLNIIPNTLISMRSALEYPPRAPRASFQSPHVSPARPAGAGLGLRRSHTSGEFGVFDAKKLMADFKFNLKSVGLFKSKRRSCRLTVEYKTVEEAFCNSIAAISCAILNNFISAEGVYLRLFYEWMIEFDFLVKGRGAEVLSAHPLRAFRDSDREMLFFHRLPFGLSVDGAEQVFNADVFVSTHILQPLTTNFYEHALVWDELEKCIQSFLIKFECLSEKIELASSFSVLNNFLDTYKSYKESISALLCFPSPVRSTASSGSVGLEIAEFSKLGLGSESDFDRTRAANPVFDEPSDVYVDDRDFKMPLAVSDTGSLDVERERVCPARDVDLSIVMPLALAKTQKKSKKRSGKNRRFVESDDSGKASYCGLKTDALAGYGDVVPEGSRKRAMTVHSSEFSDDGKCYNTATILRNITSALAAEAVPDFALDDAALNLDVFLAEFEGGEALGRETPDHFFK